MTELFETIEKMVTENSGGCYTDDMLQAAVEEIRDKAEGDVFEKVFTRLTGIKTGALLGLAVTAVMCQVFSGGIWSGCGAA